MRPRKGTENRKGVSIRLEPSEKELLVKHYGGVQAAIDAVLEKLKTDTSSAVPKTNHDKKAS